MQTVPFVFVTPNDKGMVWSAYPELASFVEDRYRPLVTYTSGDGGEIVEVFVSRTLRPRGSDAAARIDVQTRRKGRGRVGISGAGNLPGRTLPRGRVRRRPSAGTAGLSRLTLFFLLLLGPKLPSFARWTAGCRHVSSVV